jgi:hypothetical protein
MVSAIDSSQTLQKQWFQQLKLLKRYKNQCFTNLGLTNSTAPVRTTTTTTAVHKRYKNNGFSNLDL